MSCATSSPARSQYAYQRGSSIFTCLRARLKPSAFAASTSARSFSSSARVDGVGPEALVEHAGDADRARRSGAARGRAPRSSGSRRRNARRRRPAAARRHTEWGSGDQTRRSRADLAVRASPSSSGSAGRGCTRPARPRSRRCATRRSCACTRCRASRAACPSPGRTRRRAGSKASIDELVLAARLEHAGVEREVRVAALVRAERGTPSSVDRRAPVDGAEAEQRAFAATPGGCGTGCGSCAPPSPPKSRSSSGSQRSRRACGSGWLSTGRVRPACRPSSRAG